MSKKDARVSFELLSIKIYFIFLNILVAQWVRLSVINFLINVLWLEPHKQNIFSFFFSINAKRLIRLALSNLAEDNVCTISCKIW